MSTESMEWIPNGPHRTRLEAPDLVYFVWNGDMTTEHLLLSLHHIESLKHPHVVVLNDFARIGTPSAAGRKTMARDARLRLVRAVSVFNGHFTINLLLELVFRAAPFFIGGERTKLHIAKNEAEARAWLATQRSRKLSPTGS
jgi:hypothetical protein